MMTDEEGPHRDSSRWEPGERAGQERRANGALELFREWFGFEPTGQELTEAMIAEDFRAELDRRYPPRRILWVKR